MKTEYSNLTQEQKEGVIIKMALNSPIQTINPAYFLFIPKDAKGSAKATLANRILCQTLYWRERMNRRPFFKFIEPNSHNLYKEQDSWCEELYVSRYEFREALKLIGTKVRDSEEAVKLMNSKSTDVDKIIITYTDSNNLTWHMVNMRAFEYHAHKAFLAIARKQMAIDAKYADDKTLPDFVKKYNEKVTNKGELDFTLEEIEEDVSKNSDLQSVELAVQQDVTLLTDTTQIDKTLTSFIEESDDSVTTRIIEINSKKNKNKFNRGRKLTPQQASIVKEQKDGILLPLDFQPNVAMIKEGNKLGYDIEDMKYEWIAFKDYYTIGKGRTGKFCKSVDWWGRFTKQWLNNQYTTGKIKRNGKFNGNDAGNGRLGTLE